MLSCLTCAPSNIDQQVVANKKPSDIPTPKNVNKQGTKKVLLTTDGAKVHKEIQEPHIQKRIKLKIGNVVFTWKEVKVIVDDTHLLVYEKKDAGPTKKLPLHVCNVKPISRRRFEVFCAPATHLELKVKDNTIMREWVTTIQSGILRRLSAQTGADATHTKTSSGMEFLSALRSAHEANRFCADCDAPDPKWISVTLGCIVCIECSGVHRHLGVSISKVRSFELDMWTEKTEMIEKIGNADTNSSYEAVTTDPQYLKPNKDSNREIRERYIYSKYVNKTFMKRTVRSTPMSLLSPAPTPLHGVMRTPTHKRNASQKKPIHIGSDPFSPQSPHYDRSCRRGSLFEFSARKEPSPALPFGVKVPPSSHSVHTSHPTTLAANLAQQRRHSLHPRMV